MKFPYNLSPQRLTLLSKEDFDLYRYEHSPYYSYTDKVKSVREYQESYGRYMKAINEDHEYDLLTESEKHELGLGLVQLDARLTLNELSAMVYPLVSEGLSKKEFDEVMEHVETSLIDNVTTAINEGVPGKDMAYWLPNLGWLGKLSFGILSVGLAGLVGLFVAGKDKAAAKALERYMNRLVELTDSGILKKKSIFSFFGGGKYKGDQSRGCFRYAQEIAERTIAKDALILGKASGLIAGNGMDAAIEAGDNSEGGFKLFRQNVATPLDNLIIRK